MKRSTIITIVILVIVAGLIIWLVRWMSGGFSAREQPSALETFLARTSLALSMPSKAKEEKNPFTASEDLLRGARNRYEDNCALCHANNGSGLTDVGKNLYPKPPDLRKPLVQNLTDGELYFIIHNGIRLTGMPAWGPARYDSESWKYVLFIRKLPNLPDSEIQQMNDANPGGESRERH